MQTVVNLRGKDSISLKPNPKQLRRRFAAKKCRPVSLIPKLLLV